MAIPGSFVIVSTSSCRAYAIGHISGSFKNSGNYVVHSVLWASAPAS